MSTERRRCYLALLLLSNVCASVSWGIVSPTIVANCLQRGSSMLTIGVLTSVWALPFLLAAPVYIRIVGRISAKPALLVGMLADAGAVWLFPLIPYDWAWIVLQILTGAMETVEETGARIRSSVWRPVQSFSALVRGIQTGLEFYRGRQRRRGEAVAEQQDEELFI